jgi:probable phosphoglycerate mutase
MPVILLIRHGENDYVKKGRLAGHTPGVHLNEHGRLQAQALAERLKDTPIKAIYSSPLERALETAAPLAQALDLEVNPRPGLIETDIGDWAGKTVKSLGRLKAWRTVQSTPSRVRFPGGEAFRDTQFRICQELEHLVAQHDPKDLVACFSHADPIKMAVAYYLGMPLDTFQRLVVSTCSVTALMIGEHSCRLLTMNFDPSLNFSKP